jgi:hypothetical protein
MRRHFLLALAFPFIAGKLVRIQPHNYKSLYISMRRVGDKDIVSIDNLKGGKEGKKRKQELLFEIKDGTTEIAQGERKICKHPATSEIIACGVNDSLFTMWDLVSENGSVRIKTENDICLQYSNDVKRASGKKLSGQPCVKGQADQLFDIEFQGKDKDPDEKDPENFDQPLENMVGFMLNAPKFGKFPVKEKIILYDIKNKPIASFVGPIKATRPDEENLSHYYHPAIEDYIND